RRKVKGEPKKEEKKVVLLRLEARQIDSSEASKLCLRFPVTVTHGFDQSTFPLTTCGGQPAPGAIEQLSILARPEIVEKPKGSMADLMKVPGEFVSPGIKRVDPRLPVALQAVLDH